MNFFLVKGFISISTLMHRYIQKLYKRTLIQHDHVDGHTVLHWSL